MNAMLIRLAEVLYQGVWSLWERGYRGRFLPIREVSPRLISVGNLTWGGTGKTPLVELLAKKLYRQGRKVAILSRGYGSPRDRGSADEVRWLRQRLNGIPIFANPDRVQSAQKAEKEGYEVLILDDGFQHRRLARQLDIVTIDAGNPFGNGRLIPAGKLREPISSLKRADWIVLTKTDLVDEKRLNSIKEGIREVVPEIPMSETVYRPLALSVIPSLRSGRRLRSLPRQTKSGGRDDEESKGTRGSLAQGDRGNGEVFPQDLKGREVGLVAAIGNPEGFKRTVAQLGAKVTATYWKRDHSDYSMADLQKLAEIERKKALWGWVTTSKDAIKIVPLIERTQCLALSTQHLAPSTQPLAKGPTLYALEIELIFKTGESELWEAIESLLS